MTNTPKKALKIPRKYVKNLNEATSTEGFGDRVITDEYGNFIPTSEIYKNGIVNSSGNLEGFIPEVLVTPKYSITKDDLTPKLYSGNIQNHPDASYMSNSYLDSQIKKAENIAEADRRAGEVDPLTMLNLATSGTFNYATSPSQLARLGYDIATGEGSDYLKGKWFTGNPGIVPKNFAKEHPYWSLAVNGLVDLAIPTTAVSGYKFVKTNIPKYRLDWEMHKLSKTPLTKRFRNDLEYISTSSPSSKILEYQKPNIDVDDYIISVMPDEKYIKSLPKSYTEDASRVIAYEPKRGVVDSDESTVPIVPLLKRGLPETINEYMYTESPEAHYMLDFMRKEAREPIGRITLKGPSYPENGRTYTLQPTQNWSHIQSQRWHNGAYNRLLRNITTRYANTTPFNKKRLLKKKRYLDEAYFNSGSGTSDIDVNKKITGNAYVFPERWWYTEGSDRMLEYSPSTRAHEFYHMAYDPIERVPRKVFNKHTKNDDLRYLFKNYNGGEAAVRVSQLKNAAGLTHDEPLTPELFEFFRKHYNDLYGFPNVTTLNRLQDIKLYKMYREYFPRFQWGMNNNMTTFFNAIPKDKVKQFLDWANRHAIALTGAAATGAGGAGGAVQTDE